MDTSFTWKYSTAAAPALQLTQEGKVLKAAVNTAPEGESGNESGGVGGEEGSRATTPSTG